MGSILAAKCSCGFEYDWINAGGGMLDFHEVCNVPALCRNCNILVVKNYLHKFCRCPQCRKKVIFYTDPSLQKDPLEVVDETGEDNSLFYWNINYDDKPCILPNTKYLCPLCGKFDMIFEDVGCWD